MKQSIAPIRSFSLIFLCTLVPKSSIHWQGHLIRDKNGTQYHQKRIAFLEKVLIEYSGIPLFSDILCLSAGRNAWTFINQKYIFLRNRQTWYLAQVFDGKLNSHYWLSPLVIFLTDITGKTLVVFGEDVGVKHELEYFNAYLQMKSFHNSWNALLTFKMSLLFCRSLVEIKIVTT